MTLSEWCVQGPSCYFSGNNPKCLVFIKTVSWLDLYTLWRVCGFGSTSVFVPVRSCGCESMFCIHACVGPVWQLTPFQIMQENISSQKTWKIHVQLSWHTYQLLCFSVIYVLLQWLMLAMFHIMRSAYLKVTLWAGGHSDCSKWLFSDCEWTELLPCGTE